jgi:hypothetical protein
MLINVIVSGSPQAETPRHQDQWQARQQGRDLSSLPSIPRFAKCDVEGQDAEGGNRSCHPAWHELVQKRLRQRILAFQIVSLASW